MCKKNARFARIAAMGHLYDIRVKLRRSILFFFCKCIELALLFQYTAVTAM